jgi:hypothetical protein
MNSDLLSVHSNLHECAKAESRGEDVAGRVARLLKDGADPHQQDADGNTAFNIAAANSPVCGRLMTDHWLRLALAGQGPKGLNDPSGSHGSTLAQYIAKWSADDEIEEQIAAGLARGLKIDTPNKSGWTPLAAAAAMGRVKAVEVFAGRYSREALCLKTTEAYEASYDGHKVVYAAGLTAAGLAAARLEQDKGLSAEMKKALAECVRVLGSF